MGRKGGYRFFCVLSAAASASVGAMELKFSGLSPYVRKVMVVAHEVGVADRLQLTPVKTREEPEKITPVNPLGKIPALITDSGQAIYDSPVICEYLDAEFGGHRLLRRRGPVTSSGFLP